MKKYLRSLTWAHCLVFGVLLIIGLISAGVWFKAETNSFLKQAASIGLSAAVGTFLVVFGVDVIFDKERRQREEPLRVMALKRTIEAINQLTVLIAEATKASTHPDKWEEPDDFDDLLSPNVAEQMCEHLDISSKAPATSTTTWRKYWDLECGKIESKIHWTIAKYVEILPSQLLATLEEAAYSNLFSYANELPVIHKRDEASDTVRSTCFAPGGGKVIEQDFGNLLKVISELEDEADKYEEVETPRFPQRIFEERGEPIVGNAYTEEGWND